MLKKRIILGVLSIPLLILLYTIVSQRILVHTINKRSTFEYDLLYEFTDEDLDYFHTIEGFGMDTIYSNEHPAPFDVEDDNYEFDMNDYLENHAITYYDRSGYPTILGTAHLTGLETSDPELELFSLQVGETYSKEEIIDALPMSFLWRKQINESGNDAYYSFTYARVRIMITTEHDVILKYRVIVRSLPIPGVVF